MTTRPNPRTCHNYESLIPMMPPVKSIGRYFVLMLIVTNQPSLSNKWKPRSPEGQPICTSRECDRRGNYYYHNMNRMTNPCNNFYEFACGSWSKQYPTPKYKLAYEVPNILYQKTLQTIRRIFESNVIKPEQERFSLAKLVYDICVRIPQLPAQQPSAIAEYISEVGRYPFVGVWTLHNYYLRLTGESAFFHFIMLGNEATGGYPLLFIVEPDSAYGSIYHNSLWEPAEERAYMEFLYQIMKSIKLPNPDRLIRDWTRQVFEFRKNLNDIAERHKKKKANIFDPKTPRGIQNLYYEDVRHLLGLGPINIPWVAISQILLHSVKDTGLFEKRIVAFRRHQYFIDLAHLLTMTRNEIIAYHIEIYFVERHLQLTDKFYKLLESTMVEPFITTRYIRPRNIARWETCLKDHNMKETMAKLLIERAFPLSNQRSINFLIEKVASSMKSQIRASEWLDDEARKTTIDMLNSLERWIGYPPWYTNTSITPVSGEFNVLQPNAVVDIEQGYFLINLGLIKSPMYQADLPTIYNLASLGATIGHELYHIIYDCGTYTDLRTHSTVLWWSYLMQLDCDSRKQCFIKQYDYITRKEFKSRYHEEVAVDTARSFMENYADSMGLQAAYMAFNEMLQSNPGACMVLPYFEDYSCEQLFYLAFANTLCGYVDKKAAVKALPTAKHSVCSIRVNGAVMNSPDFSRVFNCPAGSPMNPTKRCDLWK